MSKKDTGVCPKRTQGYVQKGHRNITIYNNNNIADENPRILKDSFDASSLGKKISMIHSFANTKGLNLRNEIFPLYNKNVIFDLTDKEINQFAYILNTRYDFYKVALVTLEEF